MNDKLKVISDEKDGSEATVSVTDRVILWNAKRYEQKYDYNLASRLLLEETQELYDANGYIQQMDAVGDIFFVAIGVFWKLGLKSSTINEIFMSQPLHDMTLVELHEWATHVEWRMLEMIDGEIEGAYPGIKLATFAPFIIAMPMLQAMGMGHCIFEIVKIICDSNDTKSIDKVAHDVKANLDKGEDYRSPTAALQVLYSREKGRIQ